MSRLGTKRTLAILLSILTLSVGTFIWIEARQRSIGDCLPSPPFAGKSITERLTLQAALGVDGSWFLIRGWKPQGGPIDPPSDRTVRGTAELAPIGSTDWVPADVSAHDLLAEDMSAMTNKPILVKVRDTEQYKGYVLLGATLGENPEFLGECANVYSEALKNIASRTSTKPADLLRQYALQPETSELSQLMAPPPPPVTERTPDPPVHADAAAG
jgi:hypothetical protein